jgi:ribose transport system permease protein/rhamnose transport system permease protein
VTVAAQAGTQRGSLLASARRLFGSQEGVLLLLLLVLIVGVGLYNPRFLTERNLADILNGNAYIAVAAIGISMIIITGNIDISVGAIIGVLVTLSATIAADLPATGLPSEIVLLVAWTAPIVGGMLLSAVNGFFVAHLGIPAIVVTLGTFSILRGGLVLVVGGNTITEMIPGYGLAQQSLGLLPVPVVIMIVLTLVAFVWMRWSALGRFLYAIGGNREAARLSGIDVRSSLMKTFVIAGAFYGVAAVMYATQFNTIQTVVTPGLELQIITASVVGGVSILGGVGTVIGSTLAAILVRTIGAALVFVDVSPFWLRAILGVLILVTVLSDVLRRRRQARL